MVSELRHNRKADVDNGRTCYYFLRPTALSLELLTPPRLRQRPGGRRAQGDVGAALGQLHGNDFSQTTVSR